MFGFKFIRESDYNLLLEKNYVQESEIKASKSRIEKLDCELTELEIKYDALTKEYNNLLNDYSKLQNQSTEVQLLTDVATTPLTEVKKKTVNKSEKKSTSRKRVVRKNSDTKSE